MAKRPTSISVISWYFILGGGISLITTTAMINNPMVQDWMAQNPIPIPVQYAMNYIGLLVMIVSGVAMLKGANWARYLFAIWTLVVSVPGIVTSGMKAISIPGFVVFLVIAFFLFRPKATAFFVPHDETENA